INNILDLSDGSIAERFRNDNESFNEEITLQADYQSPMGKNQTVEFGAKTILRNVSSHYKYYTATGADGPFIPSTDENLTNVSNYQQYIPAADLSYTFNFRTAYSLKAGGRYEYTTTDANFQDEQKVECPSYGVFVPSVNFSRKLKNGNMVKLAYNRR